VDSLAKSWYVVVLKSDKIKLVGANLNKLDIENLIPLQKQIRQWSDRKKIVEAPIFFNYAFVRCTEKERCRVFKADGIKCFLSIGGDLAKLRDSEIVRIQRLLKYENDISIERISQGFIKGQQVEINSGSLRGLLGEVNKDCGAGSKKVRIRIESLGCFACVEISSGDLSICTERKMVS
jgi:transcription antitermination factor NusG